MNQAPEAESNELLRYGLFLAVAAASLFVLWFGFDLYERYVQPPGLAMGLKVGTLLPTPKPLVRINLVDHKGQPFTLENFRNRWTLMVIGYTSCPDVCPTLMATFKAMDKVLTPEGGKSSAEFLFVSVDPERDKPKQLGQYVSYFNPRFTGATGSQEALHVLTGQLGLMYMRAAGQESAMGYLIDHSASIVLIGPDAAWHAVFTPPHDPQAIADDVIATMGRYTAKR